MAKRIFLSLLIATAAAYAHCDGVDGPVAQATRRAISSGDVNIVLAWVKPEHEPTIRDAFNRTLNVRQQSRAAADLADLWFLETVVRIQRWRRGRL